MKLIQLSPQDIQHGYSQAHITNRGRKAYPSNGWNSLALTVTGIFGPIRQSSRKVLWLWQFILSLLLLARQLSSFSDSVRPI